MRQNLKLNQPATLREGRPLRLGPLKDRTSLDLGARPTVGDVVCPDGSQPPCPPTVSARFFVGTAKGVEARHCARAPETFPVREIDSIVLAARSAQVGVQNTGMTRYTAEGVYQGGKERTAVYEMFPAPGESLATFRERAAQVAQTAATLACQKEVYFQVEDGSGSKVTESARFEGAKRR